MTSVQHVSARMSSQNQTAAVAPSQQQQRTRSNITPTMVDMSAFSSSSSFANPRNTTSTTITYTTVPTKPPVEEQDDVTHNVSSSNNTMENEQQEEGVLRDVLQELDKERTKRAELEAQVRDLMMEKQTLAAQVEEVQSNADAAICTQTQQAVQESEISQRAFFAMEAQVQGYQQLVEALTAGKPAIAAATAQEKAALEASSSSSSASCSKNQTRTRRNNDRSTESSTSNTPPITPTLPLHVVRLLEVMPWDPRAQVHVFGSEEIYEWQVYNEKERKWTSSLKSFPKLFKMLKIAASTKESTKKNANAEKERNNLLVFLAGAGEKPVHLPTRHGVLTDKSMHYLLNIEAGFPLPQDGGVWEWIGGWRVDKRPSTEVPDDTTAPRDSEEEAAHRMMALISNNNSSSNHSNNSSLRSHSGASSGSSSSKRIERANSSSSTASIRKKVDCDENGWSYATDAIHFQTHLTELVYDNPGGNTLDAESSSGATATDEIVVERRIRRRKWSRQRVLVDYPFASERTQQFLKLLAENARLTITANKVSDQLVETKTCLTETEEKFMCYQSEMAVETAMLQQEIKQKEQLLEAAGVDASSKGKNASAISSSNNNSNPIQGFLMNNSDHGKNFGFQISKFLQGGRKASENEDDGDTSSGSFAEDNPLESSTHSISSANATAGAVTSTVTSAETSSPPTTATATRTPEAPKSPGGGVFDWRRVGPGTLLDKFKPSAPLIANNNSSTCAPTSTEHTQKSSLSENHEEKKTDDPDNDKSNVNPIAEAIALLHEDDDDDDEE